MLYIDSESSMCQLHAQTKIANVSICHVLNGKYGTALQLRPRRLGIVTITPIVLQDTSGLHSFCFF